MATSYNDKPYASKKAVIRDILDYDEKQCQAVGIAMKIAAIKAFYKG